MRRKARKEVLDTKGQGSATQPEFDSASSAAISRAHECIAMEFTAKPNGVTASRIGDVIDELKARVGSLNLGPVKAAQFLREHIEIGDLNTGESTVQRIGHSCVESILRCGNVVVAYESGLVKAVISEAGFIYPPRARGPSPVFAEHLSASVNVGEPLRLNLKRIGDRPRVVAKKIQAAEVVVIIWLKIDFPNHVVDAHSVGQAVVDLCRTRRIRTIVDGEPFPIAADRVRRGESAARNLKADRAHGAPTREHISNGVRDAVGTISRAAERTISGIGQRNRCPSVELACIADRVPLPLISSEVKQFALDDRAPGGSAKLLQVARVFRLTDRIEEVAGVKRRVASKCISRTVKLVRA